MALRIKHELQDRIREAQEQGKPFSHLIHRLQELCLRAGLIEQTGVPNDY